MDPETTSDGKPFAEQRFKAIVKERLFITANINTSYKDVGYMTPYERELVILEILDVIQKRQEALEKIKDKRKL